MQLESRRDEFEALGVRVAGMTYDSEALRAGFHTQAGLGYPMLGDVEARHVEALGVRNEDYEPGHAAYGIPHPGILVLSPSGELLAKFAVPGYRQRPPLDDVLEAVRKATGG